MKFTFEYALIPILVSFLFLLKSNIFEVGENHSPAKLESPIDYSKDASHFDFPLKKLNVVDTIDPTIDYVVDTKRSTCNTAQYKGAYISIYKRKGPSQVITLNFIKNEVNPIVEDHLYLEIIDKNTIKFLIPEIRAKYYPPIRIDSIGQITKNGDILIHLRPERNPSENCTLVLRKKRPEDAFHLLDWECPKGFSGPDCNLFNPNETQYLLNQGHSPLKLLGEQIRKKNLIGKSYGGGIIFKVDTKKKSILIAAPEDQSHSISWGCPDINLADTSNKIGAGDMSSESLISNCDSNAHALQLCLDLVLNEKDDWYLPNKTELELMKRNLHKEGIGNFDENANYWSSYVRKNKIGYLPFAKKESMRYVDRAKTAHVRAMRKIQE